ncbi:MAG: AraC family transcriptional regulator [Opitutaceae bacterium]|jgi:AraC-like DNA-binding protein
MAESRENMPKAIESPFSGHPLQLDFFQAGSFRQKVGGWVHRKIVPYVILAQATKGAYEVRCGGRHEALAPGRVLVVPAHTPVEFTHKDGPAGVMEARWLHLGFSLRGQFDFLGRFELPLQLPEKESGEIGRLISRALTANSLPDDGPEKLIVHHETAVRALGVLCRNLQPKADGRQAGRLWLRLDAVLSHIGENLAAPLSVEALAKLGGLSPARFHVVFKEATGDAPMNYVRTLRLEAAARLLVSADMKLDRVAEMTGFADAFHLSHAFKARFGVSPRDYRRSALLLYS